MPVVLGSDLVYEIRNVAPLVGIIKQVLLPGGVCLLTDPDPTARSTDVRIDLRLWGSDAGKAIRVRAPEVITPESFERLIQTLRLHLRIEEPEPEPVEED